MEHRLTRYLLLTLIALLVGCGQTGPLYLPDEPEQTEE